MQTERAAYNANKGKIQEAVANLRDDEFVRLRMLTPRESLRLMGIDDDDISKMLYESGNGPDEIYKMAGNSIVVNVIAEIFRKMFIDLGPDPGDSDQLFV
jgi:DNA (cytosine-5)-methyltransferase 1